MALYKVAVIIGTVQNVVCNERKWSMAGLYMVVSFWQNAVLYASLPLLAEANSYRRKRLKLDIWNGQIVFYQRVESRASEKVNIGTTFK